MGLFARIERDPHLVDKQLVTQLATDFLDRLQSNPQANPTIVLFGYLTHLAANDLQMEEIERGLMNRSIDFVTRILTGMQVPVERLYVGDYIYSATKSRKVDLFLQQAGEPSNFPMNPMLPVHRKHDVRSPKRVLDAALDINSAKHLVLDVTVFAIKSGRRTLLKELALKSITGISPTDISTKFNAQLVLWKPKLQELMRRIGQEDMADKVEFAVKLTGGASRSKEFTRQVSLAVSASLKAALTFNVTIPGTKHEVAIELSYSYGASYTADEGRYGDGQFADKGKGMINVTLFRFKSW